MNRARSAIGSVSSFFLLSFQLVMAQEVPDPDDDLLAPQSSTNLTVLALDWVERHAPNTSLTAHDHTLLGDAIDPQPGRLKFEHVDVSLPGNSGLAVELRRRLNPSQMQSSEFADWQLAIPTISTKMNRPGFSGDPFV